MQSTPASPRFRTCFLRVLCTWLALTAPVAWTQNVDDGYAPSADGDVQAIVVQPDGQLYFLRAKVAPAAAGTTVRKD